MTNSPAHPFTAAASPPPVLTARSLSKRYGAVQALDDVSVEVGAGEVLAIVGENGAGKSTLVRIIAGAEQPDAGSLLIDGEPASFTTPHEAHLRGVRLAPQELLLEPDLTVAENVLLGGLPTGRVGLVDWAAARREAESRLARLGLTDIDVKRRVSELGVDEKAFVQIARSFAPGLRVLIVDEPTAPMSKAEVDRLLSVLEAATAEGVAILYISHRLDEVFQLASQAVVLRDGRLVARFRRAELTSAALVSAMVGGRDLAVEHRDRAVDEDGAMSLLSVDDVTGKSLRGMSLSVRRGEVVAVYGVLGSGRDEIGPAIAGAVPRSGGSVKISGRQIRSGNVRSAVAAGIGYVPPERRSQGLALDLSVRQNLTMAMLGGLGHHGFLKRKTESMAADEWCRRLKIATPNAETPVRRLSGGSQQKVLLARWFAAGAPVLVLDEPTRGVDIATKAEIYRLIHERADEGSAILITSSDLEEVVTVADRVLVARGGRIVAELVDANQQDVAAAALVST